MMEKNRSEIIQDALDLLNEDLIEEADKLRQKTEGVSLGLTQDVPENVTEKQPRKFTGRWRRWTALAASICLLVIGSWAWNNLGIGRENGADYDGINGVEDHESRPENMGTSDGKDTLEDIVNGIWGGASAGDANPEDVVMNDGLHDYEENDRNDAIEEKDSNYEAVIEEWNEKETELDTSNGGIDVEEIIVQATMGDIYHLCDNYIRVSIVPNKIWESSSSEEEAIQQAVPIKDRYMEYVDALIEDMCESPCALTEELPPLDPEMTYHLFFERKDGEIIHCWFLEGGYVYYQQADDICVILDEETYDTMVKILAMHW